MACRVVCGRLDVIAILEPISALVSVDLPALGRPTKHANPDRKPSPTCANPLTLTSLARERSCHVRESAVALNAGRHARAGASRCGRISRPIGSAAVAAGDGALSTCSTDPGRARR